MEVSQQSNSVKGLFSRDDVKQRFNKILGKKSAGFITSVLQAIQGNKYLSKADPNTVLTAAATAAALDLPINQSLGYAYIVPYKGQAQFQIGYKGLIQLAQRSGMFKKINVTDVKKGELKSIDRMTGSFVCEWIQEGRPQLKTEGYIAYFELLNGFSKAFYMSIEDINAHAKKYSQAFKSNSGPWKTDYDAMASKTVLKLLLSRYAPLSIDMQTAQLADQSVQKEDGEYKYPDNDIETIEIQPKNTQENELKDRLKQIMLAAITDNLDKEKFKEKFQSEVEEKSDEELTRIFNNYVNVAA